MQQIHKTWAFARQVGLQFSINLKDPLKKKLIFRTRELSVSWSRIDFAQKSLMCLKLILCISFQWLCNISTSGVASGSPAPPSRLCLRHDVDGVVWQPYSGTSSTSADTPNKVEHEGTFSAFGYVKQFERELNPSGSIVDSPYSRLVFSTFFTKLNAK